MGAPEHESFGFLLGRLLYCPWTKTSFVLMDLAWQASGPLPAREQTLAFREAWTSAWQAARRRRLQVMGWYHSHGVLGLQLSVRDMEIHRRYFPDPWQTALIVVPGGDRPLGGFIQRRSALFFAQSLVPFHEVLDADAVWRDDAKPSWVDWENYRTDEAIRVVAPSVRPARAPRQPEAPEAAPSALTAQTDVETSPAVIEPDPKAEPASAPEATSSRSEEKPPRQPVKRSFAEEAQDFVSATRPTQQYDPREGSVVLPGLILPDLGDGPWRHQDPFGKHLPLPTRHLPPRAGASVPASDQAALRAGRERSSFMEVVRAPAPSTAKMAENATEAWPATADPGLAPPDTIQPAVAPDPVAEAKATLLRSGPPAPEPVEAGATLTPLRNLLPFWLEPPAGASTVLDPAGGEDLDAMSHAEGIEPLDKPAALEDLQRWVSAYKRAEGIRVKRERAEAERVDRERAEAERLARGRRVATPPSDADTERRVGAGILDADTVARPLRVPGPAAPAKRAAVEQDDQYEYTVPVVMPSKHRFPLLPRVRRHMGRIVAVVLVLGAVGAALILRVGQTAPTTPYIAPPVAAEILDFRSSGDELGRHVEAYDAARVQFEAGDIDCAALALSQAGVSQAFAALAEKFAAIGSRLPLRDRLEYERLASSARQSTGHFRTAGCAQPE